MSEDLSADEVLLVAQRALNKVNDLEDEVEDLQEDRDEILEDLTAVQLRLSEIDEDRDYDALTRNEKIGKVREHAFDRATNGHGRIALDYNDIMWGVFEGEPGVQHCYDLMEWASEARGFDVRDQSGENRQLVVDAAEAKRGVAFSSENNRVSEEGV